MHETLESETVEPLLRGRFGRPYLYARRCQSTQLELDEHAPEGAVAVCELQTAGRGRLGRHWEAPEGTAIHCSVALRPPPGRRVAELTLLAALAVTEAIEAVARVAALHRLSLLVQLEAERAGARRAGSPHGERGLPTGVAGATHALRSIV